MSKKISIFLIFFLTVFVFLLFNFWKSMAVSYLWSLKTVDSVGNVGWYTSISAVDANTIFISYYDMTNGDLKFAKSEDGGQNWSPKTVDSAGDVGWYTSISAVDTNNIFISHYDLTNKNIKFAKSEDGGENWSSKIVDSAANVGQYTSIHAINASTIFISYYKDPPGNLKFTKSEDGGENWWSKTVDSAKDVGWSTSIHAVGANTIFISYYDATNANIKFAKSEDGGQNWSSKIVDSVGGGYGSWTPTSISAVDANTIFISYYDETNANIKFAKSEDGGQNWSSKIVDSAAGASVGMFASIDAVDANTIFISYYDATNTNLKFAKSEDGGENWSPSIVATGGDGNVGTFSSMDAVDVNNIFISYQDYIFTNLLFAKSIPVINSPAVSTSAATGITSSQATLNGNITATGGQNADFRGFWWGTTQGGPYPNGCQDNGSGCEGTSANYQFVVGTFSQPIAGLSPGTTYYFQAKARNSAGWGYGGEMSFTTSSVSVIDCGLRVFDGTSIIAIACEPTGTLTSPLRIRKGGTTYGIILVPVTDANASKIRIQTSSGIKALRKY